MKEKITTLPVEHFHPPKSQWPEGNWDHEPDKLNWIDDETDLDCMIVRNTFGAYCGYVGVPPEHPLFEKGYDEAYETHVDISVHGGLTFAGACKPGATICHVAEDDRPEVWWLGFDCSHCYDASPGMLSFLKGSQGELPIREMTTYKNLAYVKNEVTQLAGQLHKAGLSVEALADEVL